MMTTHPFSKVVEARVSFANERHGDYLLSHLENSLVLNYIGRWYSALDILDYLAYNEGNFPELLMSKHTIDVPQAKAYFDYIKGYLYENLS